MDSEGTVHETRHAQLGAKSVPPLCPSRSKKGRHVFWKISDPYVPDRIVSRTNNSSLSPEELFVPIKLATSEIKSQVSCTQRHTNFVAKLRLD